MKNLTLSAIVIGLFLVFITGCLKEEDFRQDAVQLNLPEQPYDYENIQFPDQLLNTFINIAPGVFNIGSVIDPADPTSFFPANGNPAVTNDGATLGRVLFYDTKLSLNNSVSCASCHKQELAFSDPNPGSKGFQGKVTPRNSMAINNVALNNNLFWDSRVHSALELTLKPVQNHVEMGMEDLGVLEKKLAATDYYPTLFANAYGSPSITSDKIANAMAQFLCSIVSGDSKFDRAMDNGLEGLTDLEKLGMELFNSDRTQCSGCHSGANFAAADFPGGEYGGTDIKGTANTGLDLSPTDEGFGNGQFRIPSLRNIALTAPYMHDGRFATLEEVIDFYDRGIQAHPDLDKKLKGPDGEPRRLNLTSLEKKALVAFLETLTDDSMPKDIRYSDPFLR